MPDPTEHHSGPIPSPFSYVCIAACNQSQIGLPKITGGQEAETTMTLPHLLIPQCQQESPRPKSFKDNKAIVLRPGVYDRFSRVSESRNTSSVNQKIKRCVIPDVLFLWSAPF